MEEIITPQWGQFDSWKGALPAGPVKRSVVLKMSHGSSTSLSDVKSSESSQMGI